jgi:hypothetical protein
MASLRADAQMAEKTLLGRQKPAKNGQGAIKIFSGFSSAVYSKRSLEKFTFAQLGTPLNRGAE